MVDWRHILAVLIALWVISPATEFLVGYGLAQLTGGFDVLDMATMTASMLGS